jgi:hypothetical protein
VRSLRLLWIRSLVLVSTVVTVKDDRNIPWARSSCLSLSQGLCVGEVILSVLFVVDTLLYSWRQVAEIECVRDDDKLDRKAVDHKDVRFRCGTTRSNTCRSLTSAQT